MTQTRTATIEVRFFARYAELVGVERLALPFDGPVTVRDLLTRIRSTVPGAEVIPPRPLCALNAVQARGDEIVHEGDELAILPPVAGG